MTDTKILVVDDDSNISDLLKMYFENYSYVFYKHEKGYVYSADNSKPASGGFNFADGLVFETVQEGVSTKPNTDTDPPVNNETDPPANNNDKNVYEMHYLKLDIYGNSCSLISSDGNVSIDGTYIQEGDAYILSFDGDYQYVLYYNEDAGYEYVKVESNPIPGYEIEDGTWFTFNDGILTQKED